MGILIGVGNTKPVFPYDYYYGVEFDTTVSSPTLTRIGRAELHSSLPVQSQMRRCILDDTGKVVYYLHATDSTKRDTGAAADLTGASGQVMVEIPAYYYRCEMEGTKRRFLMSAQELPGFHYVPKMYCSAYEATVQRSTTKLASVVNTAADYRGGNNNTAYDGTYRTLLGRPATAISMTNFRNYARKRGSKNWNCYTYQMQKTIFWFFAVEYATLNCQLNFNAALTSEGYRQGGLGAGVTTINSTKWSEYNGSYPFVPCGHTNSLGNATGIVPFSMPKEYDATILTVNVPSYRGLENAFGHIWQLTDGCKANIQSDAAGGETQLYICDNPALFQDTNVNDYEFRGLLPRASGYIKEILFGEFADIFPLVATGGSSTTYFSDNFYTALPTTGEGLRVVLFGASAYHGANSGFGYSYVNSSWTPSTTNATVGSRLCFIPGVE